MGRGLFVRSLPVCALSLVAYGATVVASPEPQPLALDSARITIAGTSNIHAYTAATSTVRITRARLGRIDGADFWAAVMKPGGVEAFEIAVPAATLTSPKSGLDKNMHKALKVQQHTDITFRLLRFESNGTAPEGSRAIGTLQIAGVEREIAVDLRSERNGSALAVTGELELLMTDYGIAPPKAMLGMLRTDPKVKVTFEVVLGVGLT